MIKDGGDKGWGWERMRMIKDEDDKELGWGIKIFDNKK